MLVVADQHRVPNERNIIMDSLRAYLLSIVAAAVIAAVIMKLVGDKNPYSGIIRLLTGLFLSITVISPLAKIRIADAGAYFSSLQVDSAAVIEDGENTANNALGEIIKENTEAYILEKAEKIGLKIDVTVFLSEGLPPVPKSVTISGAAAPYAKMQLQAIIEKDLAIAKENQSWT